MGSRICMNATCGTATTHEWKRGWPLRSGGCADLCYNCGSAYEDFVFCDTFHLEEPGWRECYLCHKRLHCGCIASKSLLELLDYGGVGCSSCSMSSQLHHIQRDEICNGYDALTTNDTQGMRSPKVKNMVVGDGAAKGKLTHLCRVMEVKEPHLLVPSQRGDTTVLTKSDSNRSLLDIRDMQESVAQPSLSMSLGLVGSSNFVLPFSNRTVDVKEQSKVPASFQQGQQSRPILPKPPKTGLALRSETNKCTTQFRIERPPAAGQGKNHLLPRYRPRITDQELQQLSGDLNSTIVPLFEKVLTASDAGRIGRLVLPKACAEEYFPRIYQSEGVPLRIQDLKGKEWVFQFRFWPNNNSRMYVLEGVTPCIRSMQLQAGDTITFSRLDPGGKLIMGFRKAYNSGDVQDIQTSVLPNGTSGESSLSGVTENLPTVSGYSGLFQTLKGSKEHHMNAVSVHLSLAEGGIDWHKSENHGGKTTDGSPQQSVPSMEKKRTRNIGFKNKRLLMHSEEVLELRLTWQEAQDLLRPSPTSKPSMVSIEDHEFEEYDEPPVFGKRTIFTARPSGGQEQWAQCDDCSKWRKLPIDVLLPPKWTCLDNVWDSVRCSCSAPEEICHKDLENILRVSRGSLKRKIVESHRPAKEHAPSGLDALASAAVLGDDGGDSGEPSVGATTRHPRHRPGCTCIVCIQPPSGKGKHKPTCTCNVCMTVKRRFKTLMLRKKRRQSEREAEAVEFAQKNHDDLKVESEMNGARKHELSHTKSQSDVAEMETSSGQIDLDLNCHPNREDMQPEETEMNRMTLEQAAACLPVENYMQQQQPNGLVSLSSNHQLLMGRVTD